MKRHGYIPKSKATGIRPENIELRERVRQLRREGKYYKEIYEEVGYISRYTLRTWCKGIPKPPNPGNTNAPWNKGKGRVKKNKPLTCERCGFIAKIPAQIDCHHKDYNHDNNDADNIEYICSNCHRLEHHLA